MKRVFKQFNIFPFKIKNHDACKKFRCRIISFNFGEWGTADIWPVRKQITTLSTICWYKSMYICSFNYRFPIRGGLVIILMILWSLGCFCYSVQFWPSHQGQQSNSNSLWQLKMADPLLVWSVLMPNSSNDLSTIGFQVTNNFSKYLRSNQCADHVSTSSVTNYVNLL